MRLLVVDERMTVSTSIQLSGGPLPFNGLAPTPQLTTPMGLHTTALIIFLYLLGTKTMPLFLKIAPKMNSFQLQPFKITKNKFGNWFTESLRHSYLLFLTFRFKFIRYNCQGCFTQSIRVHILIGLILAFMSVFAVSMVDDIKGPDRFDDP